MLSIFEFSGDLTEEKNDNDKISRYMCVDNFAVPFITKQLQSAKNAEKKSMLISLGGFLAVFVQAPCSKS